VTGAEFDGVDIDLLADYIGGALAGTPDESAVAALVTDNPAWREAYESLGGGMALVGAELGRFAPEPMPADLAARLDAMFRTAGAPASDDQPSAVSAAAGHPEPIADPAPVPAELAAPPVPHLKLVRGDDTPDDAVERLPKRGGRRMRWATPIAIAAGFVAFAGFGLDYLAGRDASDSGGSESPANSAAGLSAESQGDAAAQAPSGGVRILATGIDYTSSTLAVSPPEPMTAPGLGSTASSKAAGPERAATVAGEPLLGRLTVRTALEDCLAAIQRENAGGTISVQTVDFARFNGSPAVVVRFAAADGQWAWASGPDCGTGGAADTLGKVPVR
jgi:hypothetical protein